MNAAGDEITSLRAGGDPRVVPACCAVMRNDGNLRQVLLLAGLEQLLLSPGAARKLAMDLETAAELAENGPGADLLGGLLPS